MSYIAKRHCPKTCEYCGKASEPHQGRARCFAGSRLWYRGTCLGCLLEQYLGAELREALAKNRENPILKFLRTPDTDDYCGGFYMIPIPLRY